MNKPLNKVSGGQIGGGIAAIILVWLYREIGGREMPLEVAIGLSSILGGVIGWLIPLEEDAIKLLKGRLSRIDDSEKIERLIDEAIQRRLAKRGNVIVIEDHTEEPIDGPTTK